MYQYSLDHNGQYPTGKSSTEVFQKLIDGKYVSNPTIFYAIGIGNRSKTPATSNELLPNNICFDVTIPVTTDSPKGLPLVFVSGFKITYEKGAKATAPFYSNGQIGGMMAFYKDDKRPNSWSVYWFGSHKVTYQKVAFYKSGDDVLRTIPNFVSQDFKPDGVKYQQLTPDGPLAP